MATEDCSIRRTSCRTQYLECRLLGDRLPDLCRDVCFPSSSPWRSLSERCLDKVGVGPKEEGRRSPPAHSTKSPREPPRWCATINLFHWDLLIYAPQLVKAVSRRLAWSIPPTARSKGLWASSARCVKQRRRWLSVAVVQPFWRASWRG